jgi:hypothetical protein
VPADRRAVAAGQAQLLCALVRGGDPPDGFDAGMAAAASLALRRKRARAVARGMPALAQALGERFEPLFEAHAARTPPPAKPGGLQDGLRFARSLPRGIELADAVRTELLLRRAQRPAFLGAVRLRDARRLLVVLRLPLAGTRVRSVPWRGRRVSTGRARTSDR